jgi:hypothetical protein
MEAFTGNGISLWSKNLYNNETDSGFNSVFTV